MSVRPEMAPGVDPDSFSTHWALCLLRLVGLGVWLKVAFFKVSESAVEAGEPEDDAPPPQQPQQNPDTDASLKPCAWCQRYATTKYCSVRCSYQALKARRRARYRGNARLRAKLKAKARRYYRFLKNPFALILVVTLSLPK